MKKINFITLTLIFLAGPLLAQFDGTIDSTFAENGVFLYNFDDDQKDDLVEKAAFGPDGKLYIAGYSATPNRNIFLIRLLPDGTLDDTFGNGGTVEFDPSIGANDVLTDMVIMDNGKIVIVGYIDFSPADQLVARFNSDGSLDQSFFQVGFRIIGGSGWDTVQACSVDDNGRILMVGNTSTQEGQNLTVMRLLPDGSNDTDFAFGGLNVFDYADTELFTYVHVQSPNRVYLLGTVDGKDRLFCMDGSGELVQDFGNNGYVSLNIYGNDWEFFSHVTTDADGNIYLTGTVMDPDFESDVLIGKFSSDGTKDIGFAAGGFYRASLGGGEEILANELHILPNGNLLFSASYQLGSNRDMLTFQLAPDGFFLASYGTNGVIDYEVPNQKDEFNTGMAVDGDGDVYLYGASDQASGFEVVVIKLKSSLSTSVLDQAILPPAEVDLYPNPASDVLWLRFQTERSQGVQIRILDAAGAHRGQLPFQEFPIGSHQVDASSLLSGLPSGWYVVQLQMEEGMIAKKLFKH